MRVLFGLRKRRFRGSQMRLSFELSRGKHSDLTDKSTAREHACISSDCTAGIAERSRVRNGRENLPVGMRTEAALVQNAADDSSGLQRRLW